MYRIIGGDGREYGPVSPAQIEQWIAQHRANGRTMVKPEGTTEWKPLAEIAEFATAFGPRSPLPPQLPPPAAAPAADETIPAAAPRDPAEAARACVGRPWQLSVFDTLSQGWAILTGRFWLAVGSTTLLVLTSGVLSGLPYVGSVVIFAFQLVFLAGAYWLMLRLSRGEPATTGDIFAGFTRAFRPLVLLTLIATLATRALALLALGPLLWRLHQSGWLSGAELAQIALGGDPFSELFVLGLQGRALPGAQELLGPLLALPVLLLPLIYISTAWIFAPLLVIDRGLAPLEALRVSRRVANRRWFRLFFLNLAFIPLVIAGLLCFGVGVFVVLALSLASYTAAYETAFRDPPATAPRDAERAPDLHG